MSYNTDKDMLPLKRNFIGDFVHDDKLLSSYIVSTR